MLFHFTAANSTWVAICMFLALAPQIAPAEASVRECGPLVEGAGVTGANELEAKRGALEAWLTKVGPGAAWHLATNKGIICSAAADGRIVCKASGHPCVLHQVPPNENLKRLMPSAPGNPT